MIEYKPSMFNRIVNYNNVTLLYNSKKGLNGIRKISDDNKQQIIKTLSLSGGIIVENDCNSVLRKLIDCGYLVPIDTNEKMIRSFIQNTFLCEQTLSIVVHLTEDCNFRCTYCYMEHKRISINQDTQNGIINYVRKNISKFKSVTMSWFGGEPTLEMDIITNLSKAIIDICKKAGKPYNGVITTNGYLLSPRNINSLIDSRVMTICVTVDGIKDVHNQQRKLLNGGETFDKITSNLLYIKNNINKRIPDVVLRINITKSHIKMLPEYIQYFDSLFGSDHRFSLFIRPVADYGGDRVKNLSDDFIEDMSEVYEIISETSSDINFNFNFMDLNVGGSTCKSKNYYKFTIGCNGSVHKCDESLDSPLGQLSCDGKMTVDLPHYASWLAGHRSNECDDCFFSLCCFMEGCPRERVFNNKTLGCHINFHEIDALIYCYYKKYNCESL